MKSRGSDSLLAATFFLALAPMHACSDGEPPGDSAPLETGDPDTATTELPPLTDGFEGGLTDCLLIFQGGGLWGQSPRVKASGSDASLVLEALPISLEMELESSYLLSVAEGEVIIGVYYYPDATCAIGCPGETDCVNPSPGPAFRATAGELLLVTWQDTADITFSDVQLEPVDGGATLVVEELAFEGVSSLVCEDTIYY